MKTPEQMAEEYASEYVTDPGYILSKSGFLAGYQAAKDEEVTKDQKIAALWTESIKNMLPSVHEVVLFPSESTRARDAEVVAKMDAAIKKAKDQLADADKMMPQWISVKERLPEDNLEVLFFSQEYDGCFVGYKAAEGSYVDPESNGLSVSNIQKYYTYWRLLPEPPEEKK